MKLISLKCRAIGQMKRIAGNDSFGPRRSQIEEKSV